LIITDKDKEYAETKAVSNCIAELDKKPEALAEFISALSRGKHKEWAIYKTEYGKAISLTYRGRSIPQRKSKGSSGRLPFGQIFGLTKPVQHKISAINFSKCKTKVEKVKLILKENISKELKQEMIEFVLNQH